MSRSCKAGRIPFTRPQVASALFLVSGALLLALAALVLFRQIEPARVWLDARADSEARVLFRVEPPGTYIPYYVHNPDRARIRGGENFASTSFLIENETTPWFCFDFDRSAAHLEIRGMRMQTLFARRDWSARELSLLLTAQSGSLELPGAGETLSLTTQESPTSLCTVQDVRNVLAELHQFDTLVLLGLGVASLALFVAALLISSNRKSHAPPISGKRLTWLHLLILALFLYGCFRIFYLTAHTPLLGYANTGDFFRLFSCYGLEAVTAIDPFSPQLRVAPLPTFLYRGAPIKEACYLSSQSFLIDGTRLLNLLAGPDGWTNPLEVRLLGIFSSAMLCIVSGLLILLYTRVSLRFALCLVLVFALVLTDPFVTLFANTFLSEMSAVLFGTASIALAIYILVARDWSPRIILLLAIALFLFGASRVQNYLLPICLTAWLALVGMYHWRRVAPNASPVPLAAANLRRSSIVLGICIVLGASILAYSVQSLSNSRPGYMNAIEMVNRADTYFGALLPSLREPQAGLTLLGLDASCEPYIGKTWYDMQPALTECARQARELPLSAYLKLLWFDPMIVAQLAPKVVDRTRPWIVDYVGHVQGEEFGRTDMRFPAATWSLVSVIHALPRDLYQVLVVFLGLSAVLAGVVLGISLLRDVPRRWVELALVQWLMTGIFLYIVSTALLGDGWLDYAKHTFFAKPALLVGTAVGFALVCAVLMAAGSTIRRKMPTPALQKRIPQ